MTRWEWSNVFQSLLHFFDHIDWKYINLAQRLSSNLYKSINVFFATALNMIWIKPGTKVAVTIGIMHRNKLSNKLAWE